MTRRSPAVKRLLPVLPPLDLALSSRIALVGPRRIIDLRNAATGLEIELTIARASVLTLTVEDPGWSLLREKLLTDTVDLELGPDEAEADRSPAARHARRDLRYVRAWRMDRKRGVGGIATQDTTTTLRFWGLAPAALKAQADPIRKPADRLDLRGFVALLAREVSDDITLTAVVPNPGALPPTDDARAASSPGFSDTAARQLTVKGQSADREQLRNMDRVLSVAVRLNAPARAVLAMVVANIGEADYRTRARNPDSGAYGLFQLLPSTAQSFGLDPLDIEACAEQFLVHGFTRGKTGENGAIPMSKAGPSLSAGTIAARVEGSGVGGQFYDRHDTEARRIIEAWSGRPPSEWRRVTGSSSGAGEQRPSEWRRGTSQQRESSWACLGRYAEDFGRRRFESANRLVVARDQDLILAQPHMSVALDDAVFAARPAIDQDGSARLVTLECQAFTEGWTAPPGGVVDLEDAGPATGSWIVETLRARAGDPIVDVTLTQPTTEPPQRSSRASAAAAGRGGNAAVRWAAGQVGVRESGPNRGEKIERWQHAFGFGPGTPWCGIFVGMAMRAAGVTVPAWIASTGAISSNARAKRSPLRGVTTAERAKPGDLALIGPPGPNGHVGIVERVDRTAQIVHTIEGNYSNGVGRAQRAFSSVHSIAQVSYS